MATELVDLELTEENVRKALQQIDDPELGINIVDLGLVYEISIEDGAVSVLMTLTTPFCPVGPMIKNQVDTVLKSSLRDVKKGSVEFTFNPPWDKDMMSDEAKDELGLW